MTTTYRWNTSELALAYEQSAEHVHPYYAEMQETILALLPFSTDDEIVIVDAGGGSGRLAVKLLSRFSRAKVVILDQSEPFLAVAERRLAPFGERGECRLCRLQDDWLKQLDTAPNAIVSMSAIHHLDSAEKRQFYQHGFESLRPGGVLLNGDEVRAASDADYLEQCQTWVAHMHRVRAAGLIPNAMCAALRNWEQRNVEQFGSPRTSGDDCHETAAAQLDYCRDAGFVALDIPWQRGLWAILQAVKS